MARAKNKDYHVIISNPSQGIEVVADLPEQFSVGIQNQFEGGTGAIGAGLTAGYGPGVSGGDVVFKPFTKLVWRGTSVIEFNLSLLFDAEENAKDDVLHTAARLAMLALPDSGSQGSWLTPGSGKYAFVGPPNPTRLSDHNKTSVRIGSQYFFESVAIASASPMTESRLHHSGFPIAGGIELAVQTDTMYDKSDWALATGLAYADPGSGVNLGNLIEENVVNFGSLSLSGITLRQILGF